MLAFCFFSVTRRVLNISLCSVLYVLYHFLSFAEFILFIAVFVENIVFASTSLFVALLYLILPVASISHLHMWSLFQIECMLMTLYCPISQLDHIEQPCLSCFVFSPTFISLVSLINFHPVSICAMFFQNVTHWFLSWIIQNLLSFDAYNFRSSWRIKFLNILLWFIICFKKHFCKIPSVHNSDFYMHIFPSQFLHV